jgi:hypothetical protein
MPPMKNIYNLISDAFTQMDREGIETDYTIDVEFVEQPLKTYTITIKSKNPNAIGSATLVLTLDNANNLIDYSDQNDLFINSNWDRFCVVFEGQLEMPGLNTLQQYILQYANELSNPEEDEFEV